MTQLASTENPVSEIQTTKDVLSEPIMQDKNTDRRLTILLKCSGVMFLIGVILVLGDTLGIFSSSENGILSWVILWVVLGSFVLFGLYHWAENASYNKAKEDYRDKLEAAMKNDLRKQYNLARIKFLNINGDYVFVWRNTLRKKGKSDLLQAIVRFEDTIEIKKYRRVFMQDNDMVGLSEE